MKARLIPALFFVLGGVALLAQPPAPAKATPRVYSNAIGFSYSLPADWEVVDMSGSFSAAQQQSQQMAQSDEEKRGLSCLQIALTAHHGTPGSMVTAVDLPSACMGAEMDAKDLPGFGTGATQGIQQSFDLSEPEVATYSLGSHGMWISRGKGNPKGHPELQYTIETVCGLLKKGAVCWMALTADDVALHAFERGAVVLDGESAGALVPARVFARKPPAASPSKH